MRRFLIAVLAVAALGIAGLVAATVVVARAVSHTAMAGWAEAAGVTVRVDGATDFAVLPSPRAVVRDVRLSVPGVGDVHAARAEIVAHPETILRGRFVSAGVRLVGAVVVLAQGDGPDVPVRPMGRVDVVDGRLVPGRGLPDLAFAGSLRGTQGDGIAADLRLGSDGAIALLVEAGPVAADGRRSVRVRATRGGDAIGFEGERAGGATSGRLALTAPTLAQSLAAMGLPAELLPARAAELTATMRVDPAGVALDGIRGQLDVGDVAGSVRWGPEGLRGRIDAGRVPVDRLAAPAMALARTTVPVALDLRLAGVAWGEVELGIAAIAVRRDGTVLSAALADAALFDGSVAGGVAIDSGSGDVALSGSLRLNGVDAERLLRALGAGPAASGDLRGVVDWQLPAAGPGGAAGAPAAARLAGEGRIVLTGGRVGVGVFGLDAPLPLDGLSGAFTIGGGRATFPSIGLVSPPQRFAGRGTVDLATLGLDFAFAPLDGADGRLPRTGFLLRGAAGAARIEGAPVAVEEPAGAIPTPAAPARGERAAPPSPPMPLPSALGRGG